MTEDDAKNKALELINRSTIALLGTNAPDGYPNIKAMIKMENVGLKETWFSTNKSSGRVAQLQKDPRSCIYFVDFKKWEGLMLAGDMDILEDPESKKRLWRKGFEKYYPAGVDDPDYCALRFAAKWGNYYHGLENKSFNIGADK